MPAKRTKKTIGRKTAAGKPKKDNPQRSTLQISVHRTQAVFLLLMFSVVGVLMGVGIWKAGSFISSYLDRSSRYDKMIVAAGRRNGVYPPLLKAVIWKESRFDASARGSKGEIGLMQVMPSSAVKDWERTFQRQVPSDGALMDPALNIEIGSWFLGRALERWKDYNDAEALALCEYNAGIQRAESWKPLLHDGEVMPNIDIESTRKYVRDILERRDQYAKEWKWEKLK
ncbi:MAG: transglycosylase SLT domain-containing protein [Lentisphaeria bacterium]|nr:transglycosylase SLT domain-containing protein [Lentisphaeria bacterium]